MAVGVALKQDALKRSELIRLQRVYLYLPFHPHCRDPTGLVNRVGGIVERKGMRAHVVALKKINLTLMSADRMAIFGHNGAGKTSLLRVMAGIFHPSAGTCAISGRVSALLSSTIGMSVKNSGRANIRLACGMFDVPRSQWNEFEREVIEFSELGEFIDLPVSSYSAGMRTRLGFAIVSSIDPDILVIDEVLSAGDMGFTKKAQKRILNMIERAHGLVVSSHSADLMRMFCNRGVWLERGQVVMDGEFEQVWRAYYEHIARSQ